MVQAREVATQEAAAAVAAEKTEHKRVQAVLMDVVVERLAAEMAAEAAEAAELECRARLRRREEELREEQERGRSLAELAELTAQDARIAAVQSRLRGRGGSLPA